MRTTVRFDEELLQAAKQHALDTGRTLTSVLEDALRHELARADHMRPLQSFRVRVIHSALQPGVSLDDNAALLDVMDSR